MVYHRTRAYRSIFRESGFGDKLWTRFHFPIPQVKLGRQHIVLGWDTSTGSIIVERPTPLNEETETWIKAVEPFAG